MKFGSGRMIPIYYFDGVHLICENLDALHTIAKDIGLKRTHFQDKDIPHYDLWGRPAKRILEWDNTKVVSTKKLIKLARSFKTSGE